MRSFAFKRRALPAISVISFSLLSFELLAHLLGVLADSVLAELMVFLGLLTELAVKFVLAVSSLLLFAAGLLGPASVLLLAFVAGLAWHQNVSGSVMSRYSSVDCSTTVTWQSSTARPF